MQTDDESDETATRRAGAELPSEQADHRAIDEATARLLVHWRDVLDRLGSV